MQRTSRPLQTAVLCGAVAAALLAAAPVGAQSIPIVLPITPVGTAPSPPIILPVLGDTRHGGLWQTSGGADVDFDRDRSRARGQVILSE